VPIIIIIIIIIIVYYLPTNVCKLIELKWLKSGQAVKPAAYFGIQYRLRIYYSSTEC
jgi:hypothetical protein